jgi:uncharacterized protein (TIGR02594 family)
MMTDAAFVRHVHSRLIARGDLAGPVSAAASAALIAAFDRAAPSPSGDRPPAGPLTADAFVRWAQGRLQNLRRYVGALDGLAGPKTVAATDAALPLPPAAALAGTPLPWLEAGKETLGWHETRDNARLRAWLKRDKATLGDPDSLPWCGDWQETCIRLGLPDEPLEGELGRNPYFALHWAGFGRRLEDPAYGAICVKRRKGGGGHVFTAVAQDVTGAWIYGLGGNQGDSVCIRRFPRAAIIAARFPKTWPGVAQPLPIWTGADVPETAAEF